MDRLPPGRRYGIRRRGRIALHGQAGQDSLEKVALLDEHAGQLARHDHRAAQDQTDEDDEESRGCPDRNRELCGVLRADEQRTRGEQERDRDQSEPDNRRRVNPRCE